MYDPVLKQLRQYISKDVMAPFKTSQEFSDYVRTTYYVNVDGTPITALEGEEEEEEESKKEEGKREGKSEGGGKRNNSNSGGGRKKWII